MHKQISQLGIAIALVSVALSASLSGQATTRAGDPLDRRLPEFRCDDIAFAEVVRFLADVSEMSFHVDWGAVEAAGITRTTPVTVRQRKPIAVRELIGVVLQQAGGDKLAFDSQFGMVTIGTPASLQADRDTLEQRRKTAPAILLKKVQPVTYKGECLENVMRDLSLETKATIELDWPQLVRAGIARADEWGPGWVTPEIAASLPLTTVLDALHAITRQCGCDYVVHGEKVFITVPSPATQPASRPAPR